MVDVLILPGSSITPRIAYDNALDDATLVASSEADASHVVDLVTDWRTDRRWKPASLPATITATWATAKTLRTWCAYGHNLGACGCSVSVEYTTDGVTWTAWAAAVAPSGSECLYKPQDEISASGLRFTITGTTPPEIGILFAGDELLPDTGCPVGWTPPRLATRDRKEVARNLQGQPVGTSVLYREAPVTFSLTAVSHGFAHSDWYDFREACHARPFFLHWNTEQDPNGACLIVEAEFDQCPGIAPFYHRVGFSGVALL